MSNKDWFNDFMDYKLSGTNSTETPSGSSGCFPWILAAIVILGLISKLFS